MSKLMTLVAIAASVAISMAANADTGTTLDSIAGAATLDGLVKPVRDLANVLMDGHAVPDTEATDASHIATAAVYGMDVLLTWNCRHMANPVTLPKTAMLVCKAGYTCPIIVTPQEFLDRKEEFGYEN